MRRAHFACCVLFQKRSITNVRDGYTTQRGGEGFAVKTSDTVVNILYLPAQGLKGFPSCSGSPRGSPGRGTPEHSGPHSSPRAAARPHSVSVRTPRWCWAVSGLALAGDVSAASVPSYSIPRAASQTNAGILKAYLVNIRFHTVSSSISHPGPRAKDKSNDATLHFWPHCCWSPLPPLPSPQVSK